MAGYGREQVESFKVVEGFDGRAYFCARVKIELTERLTRGHYDRHFHPRLLLAVERGGNREAEHGDLEELRRH